MKTFREYLDDCSFEDVWTQIADNFSEPAAIKPVYAEYYEKLKALPSKPVNGEIELAESPELQPKGMNAAPDWLIDKKVNTSCGDSAYISAALLYWASLLTFLTSKEHDDDLAAYLDIIESDDCRALVEYMNKSMTPKPYEAEMRESIERKEDLFWRGIRDVSYCGDWRSILFVLKRKLEYDMTFMRGFADHYGREHDADRMQLCCNLIDGATSHMYPDERGRRMLHLLFKILDREIIGWSD